jgi:signal transduction histidine kinase
MKSFKNISLKHKILFVFTTITVFLVAVMARISYESVKENYLGQAEAHVKRLSAYLATSIETKYLDFVAKGHTGRASAMYRTILQDEVQKSGLENAFLFDRQFKILAMAKDGVSPSQLALNQNEILLITPGESGVSFPFHDDAGRWFIWGFYRLDDNYYLGIEENASRLETLNNLSSVFLGIGLAGIVLTLIAGWFIARAIAEPVEKLVSYSQQIGSGEFTAQPPKNISGEFAILKNSMLQMQNNLARQNQEREQMLAQIAHEIRNPLGGIELLAGLVMENLKSDETSELHLKKIIDEVHGLKGQLGLFLEFSKPQPVHKKTVDLEQLSKEVKTNFTTEIEQKKIDFKIQNQLGPVFFDAGHLKQILNNLVANSIEAVANNGQISILSNRRDGAVCVQVKDDGPGIGKSKLKDIFNPFYTTKANGTGLGLAICKKLCRANKADIFVENNPEKGCTFTLEIGNNGIKKNYNC